jgi:hypothetical protein
LIGGQTLTVSQAAAPPVCEPGQNDLSNPPNYPNAVRITVVSSPTQVDLSTTTGLNVDFRLQAPAAPVTKVTLVLSDGTSWPMVGPSDRDLRDQTALGFMPKQAGTLTWTLVVEDARGCTGKTTARSVRVKP